MASIYWAWWERGPGPVITWQCPLHFEKRGTRADSGAGRFRQELLKLDAVTPEHRLRLIGISGCELGLDRNAITLGYNEDSRNGV